MAADWTDPAKPTYAISTDTANGAVYGGLLHDELLRLTIANASDLNHVSQLGDVLTLVYDSRVAVGDQPTVDAKVAAHLGRDLEAAEEPLKNSLLASRTDIAFLEEEFDSSNDLVARRRYGDIGRTVLLEELIITYDVGNKRLTETITVFNAAGKTIATQTWDYTRTTVGTQTFVRKLLRP